MRVFVLSLLAIAAAHGATTPAWGSGHMPALRMAEAAPASNLALRGGVVDFVKGAVNSMKQAVMRAPGGLQRLDCQNASQGAGRRVQCPCCARGQPCVAGRPRCVCVCVAPGAGAAGRACGQRTSVNNGVGGAGRRAEEDR